MNGRLKKIRWVFFMNVTEMDGFRFFLAVTSYWVLPVIVITCGCAMVSITA
jgi:hypothetical protein